MTDLLFRFTPETTIRGTTVVSESGQAFSVYDFIEVLGRPCFRKKKPSSFAKNIWKRLIWKDAHRMNEIKNWYFEAPIRKSVKVNRKFQCPVMTVSGLQKLWELLKDLFYNKFLDDVGVEYAGSALNVVKVTLERYMTGDHSMVEEITPANPSAVGAKRALASEAEAPRKKKRVSPDTDDVVLELPGGMTVRGTRAPTAPAHMFWANDVSCEVFSAYDFIDAIVRQTTCVPTYANISRVWWKRLTTAENTEAAELRGMSMQASMRLSPQSNRRFLTPAMGVRGLDRLFVFMKYEFDCSIDNWGRTRIRGRKVHARQLDKAMCTGLYAMFKEFYDGNGSGIRAARE